MEDEYHLYLEMKNEMTVRLSLPGQKKVKDIDQYNLYAQEKLLRYLKSHRHSYDCSYTGGQEHNSCPRN